MFHSSANPSKSSSSISLLKNSDNSRGRQTGMSTSVESLDWSLWSSMTPVFWNPDWIVSGHVNPLHNILECCVMHPPGGETLVTIQGSHCWHCGVVRHGPNCLWAALQNNLVIGTNSGCEKISGQGFPTPLPRPDYYYSCHSVGCPRRLVLITSQHAKGMNRSVGRFQHDRECCAVSSSMATAQMCQLWTCSLQTPLEFDCTPGNCG